MKKIILLGLISLSSYAEDPLTLGLYLNPDSSINYDGRVSNGKKYDSEFDLGSAAYGLSLGIEHEFHRDNSFSLSFGGRGFLDFPRKAKKETGVIDGSAFIENSPQVSFMNISLSPFIKGEVEIDEKLSLFGTVGPHLSKTYFKENDYFDYEDPTTFGYIVSAGASYERVSLEVIYRSIKPEINGTGKGVNDGLNISGDSDFSSTMLMISYDF